MNKAMITTATTDEFSAVTGIAHLQQRQALPRRGRRLATTPAGSQPASAAG